MPARRNPERELPGVADLQLGRDRCDWHDCDNTALVTIPDVQYKVRGEHLFRTRTVKFCNAHDAQARRTGRMTLRDHPDALDGLR